MPQVSRDLPEPGEVLPVHPTPGRSEVGKSAVARGVRGRCPRCGQGKLFAAWLRFAAMCEICGEDFRASDSGDGPAVFVIFAVGALATPLAILFLLATGSVLWTGLIFIPFSVGLCLAFLQPFKGVFRALQWAQREARAPRAEPDRPET